MTEAIWIKDPLAILADGAERGVVVADGAIVELVGTGKEPDDRRRDVRGARPCRHARPDQHPSSFLPDADARLPAALDRELFPWLQGALSDLGAG